MKKQLAAAILPVSLATAAWAQAPKSFRYGLHETVLPPFKQVVVEANVDITLVEEEQLLVAYTEGDQDLVQEILFDVRNDILYIHSLRNRYYNGKIQVTLPVSRLQKLEVNAKSDVVTLNTLQSPRLEMHFKGDVTARILSAGKVALNVDDDYTISQLRQTRVARAD